MYDVQVTVDHHAFTVVRVIIELSPFLFFSFIGRYAVHTSQYDSSVIITGVHGVFTRSQIQSIFARLSKYNSTISALNFTSSNFFLGGSFAFANFSCANKNDTSSHDHFNAQMFTQSIFRIQLRILIDSVFWTGVCINGV